ncbi:Spc98 family-domain-containing protein [Pseudoneurospora amorphoporcata]|uniref:Spindle pole body component n=1 Tax=Pseudoneurospora amorphoporcata TaxID=241081 RepID=A0AAN6P622_9PEZI|nr:Spc98 family-domain-containing protein [Pseudoneurospora amorphoporcata]
MAEERDTSADLFAIPNFWPSSRFLDQDKAANPLFSPNLEISASSFQFLPFGNQDKPLNSLKRPLQEEGQTSFFRLPPVLREATLSHDAQLSDDLFSDGIGGIENGKKGESPDGLDDQEDYWLTLEDVKPKTPEYKSWEAFNPTAHQGPSDVVFLSEAGPVAFDALVTEIPDDGTEPVPDILDNALYYACLLGLAQGRSSVLFSWDSEKGAFVKTAPHLRISGVSVQLMQSMDQRCLDCGNAVKALGSFSESAYFESPTPTSVALAKVVDQLVLAVQTEVAARSKAVRSILQLQSVVMPAHAILTYFHALSKKLTLEKTEEGMLSCLFREAQAVEYQGGLLPEIICQVLRLASKPWIEFVEEWIGLKNETGAPISKTGSGKSFVKVADKMWIDDHGFELEEPDFFLDEERMPSFVPQDIARSIFDTGRNLRFLKEHHPDHFLSKRSVVALTQPPKLEWQFSWDAITLLETRVNEYKAAVTRLVQGTASGDHFSPTRPSTTYEPNEYKLTYFGKSEEEVAAAVLASINQLAQPLENHESDDELTTMLHNRLYSTANQPSNKEESFNPHWSLVPLLSFSSLVDTQSKLVNDECMKLLLGPHKLRVHTSLMRQYFLLGNGMLCSRLSHALFDPDLESAERKAGVAFSGGVMGLRLGGRDTWPPASSELRLALMGVLSDCYEPPAGEEDSDEQEEDRSMRKSMLSRTYSSDLPGDLSFAVRDLTSDEINKCMDPDGLEALDFLRLSYKAPSGLQYIMTPVILLKYDRINKHLLRMLRMLYVVNHLSRDVQLLARRTRLSNATIRFCTEANHFVSKMAAYFFDSGITTIWSQFEEWLDSIEAEFLGSGVAGDGTSHPLSKENNQRSSSCSPDLVRDKQSHCLDEIMSALFLRKRQTPVLKLLEEIFTIILRFARLLRSNNNTQNMKPTVSGKGKSKEQPTKDKDSEYANDTPERLYGMLRKNVEVFLTVCKGLGEKAAASKNKGYGHGHNGNGGLGRVGESLAEMIPLALDMMGYYEGGGGSGRRYQG